MALFKKLMYRLKQQLKIHSDMANEVGLEINAGKTKWMFIGKSIDELTLNEEVIERVDDFIYIGSSVKSTESDIRRRHWRGQHFTR